MAIFNRGTGLLVIEVKDSNPNGNPDAEGEPRVLDSDGRGLISPVSLKRKLRDLLPPDEEADGSKFDVWTEASSTLGITNCAQRSYFILETRGRDRDKISKMGQDEFTSKYWDARQFGNTFLESMKKEKIKKPTKRSSSKSTEGDEIEDEDTVAVPKGREHFIATGVTQFGPGLSVSPVEIVRLTTTNKAGVQEGKDRGMAPLAWRVVHYGVYVMPFFVNPGAARKSGCDTNDVDLLKFLIPHAYRQTASNVRPFVEILHAWYAEHKTPLGSCPDSLIINAMTPMRIDRTRENEPSRRIADYVIPDELPPEILSRLYLFEDLCVKSWV